MKKLEPWKIFKKMWLARPLRVCTNCKFCSLCEENIMAGQKYRDGRKPDRIAHEVCVQVIFPGYQILCSHQPWLYRGKCMKCGLRLKDDPTNPLLFQ